ncbi:ASCH domain protein [Xenorhabdus bovienii str. oregonense]|uniref:ASCH domain protein n=1 Tax=Xenorhabdus bovienii str. oregonense TaxID=1398202 RepID=A0A077NSZ8_XENBV|nr:ASCH domain-containing protein [Xenorhabdus bovienii]CDH05217.1 ASCH domain protein [Xenorhabdus bovienii str. oregonense]
MLPLKQLHQKYPLASSWSFGDSPELADELARLVVYGKKTATCSAMESRKRENNLPVIGAYNIIKDGNERPVCVIRTTVIRLVRFTDVTEEMARKEGEGDLSLSYWRKEHQNFFEREGTYSENMELVFEEFELIETE